MLSIHIAAFLRMSLSGTLSRVSECQMQQRSGPMFRHHYIRGGPCGAAMRCIHRTSARLHDLLASTVVVKRSALAKAEI
jgi:hypothetical protein